MSAFLNRFAIPFVGLKEGTHNFDYEITDLFFESFELSEIKKGNLMAAVVLEKQAGMLTLKFSISGVISIECDICLDEIIFPLTTSAVLFVKSGNEYVEETDEIIVIPSSSNEINVAQYIYEYIHLALPIRRVHPQDNDGNSTCNADMLKQLQKLNVRNSENAAWDALKNLNIN